MKKGLSIVLAITMIASMSTVAFARDTDWSVGSSFDWSPTASTDVTTYENSIRADVDFTFDQTAADENNAIYFFTMEHNVGSGTKLISDLKVSNLPNVGYDTDDDDGDGYHEEAEAYEGYGNALEANTDYYFIAWWDKDTSAVPAGTVDTVAQRSANLIEMQAIHYDLLTQTSFGALRNTPTTSFAEYAEDEKSKVLLNDTITTIQDVEALKNNQYMEVQTLISNGSLNNQPVEATITFNGEVTLQDLSDLLENNQATLTNYESKFTNENGDWITAEHTTLNTGELISNVSEALVEKEEAINYCGVTSAKISLNLNDTNYNNIIENELVYFMDLSTELVPTAMQVSDGDTEYIVSDFAYLLEMSK